MKKIENVDIVPCLKKILRANTMLNFSDFFSNENLMYSTLARKKKYPQLFVWMLRKSGSECVEQEQLYLRNSQSFGQIKHYIHAKETILALIVEVTSMNDGNLYGNLFPVNYLSYVDYVDAHAVEMAPERIWIYEKGIIRSERRPASLEVNLGVLFRENGVPVSPAALNKALDTESKLRSIARTISFEEYFESITVNQ